jgi:acyl-coenzyme A synthetase/AMP-(fatty) acid ligase
MEDGNLLLVARKDNMYKIRGHRVEANAVELLLLRYTDVLEAVVKAFPDSRGHNILCGYFLADERKDPKKIKEFLRENLPYYMVPTCLIQLKDFPRNLNNKVNRAAILPPKEIDDYKLLESLY